MLGTKRLASPTLDSHVVTNVRTGYLCTLGWESRQKQREQLSCEWSRWADPSTSSGESRQKQREWVCLWQVESQQTKCQDSLVSENGKVGPFGWALPRCATERTLREQQSEYQREQGRGRGRSAELKNPG